MLEEVLVKPVGGAHPVVCVGPNTCSDRDTILSRAPSFRWDVKPRSWLSVVRKKSQDVFQKSRCVTPGNPGQICPMASVHHGLLIIPMHILIVSITMVEVLVHYGCWYHPGGCCPLVVVEEISPFYILWVCDMFKRILNPKMKITLIIYSPSSCYKPVWVSFFCWGQRKIFWRTIGTKQLFGTIDLHSSNKNTM